MVAGSEWLSYTINMHHNRYLDFFCKYFTQVGDGIFLCILALMFFAVKREYGLTILLAFAASSGFAQLLKHTLYSDEMRPSVILQHLPLHFVDGVEMHQRQSFPSGHTTSAFAAFSVLAFIYNRSYAWQLLFLIAGVLVGFTRIYLLQHFLRDTVAGSLLGVFWAVLVFWLFIKKEWAHRFFKLFMNEV